jgi:hypothetical protein
VVKSYKYLLLAAVLSLLTYSAVRLNIRTQEQNSLVMQQASLIEECITSNVDKYCPSLFKYAASLEDENANLNRIVYTINKKLIECEDESDSEE